VSLENHRERTSRKIIQKNPHEVGDLDESLSLLQIGHTYAHRHAVVAILQGIQLV
tara:strand:+ start:507 stop:671 length:165 start_codon:yes stop_codon:yes gene_type:complete